MTDRYQPLRDLAREHHLDAVALVPGANFSRLYRKDFHQNERPLTVVIPVAGPPAAVVPNLELGSFALVDFEGEVFDWRDQTGYADAFSALLQHLRISSVGVEGQNMRVFVHHAFKQANPALNIVDAEKAISGLRLLKNADEIAALESAIEISENALRHTLEQVAIGMSETDIESLLKQQLFACGAADFSFAPIVAAGTNSARPHASSRADYAIKAGDALLIDFGARFDGVCADITRTFFLQQCSDQDREVYNTVLAANQKGIDATRAGASAHDIDDVTTAHLEASAFADRIRHKTGHGLGRDIHEDPYIMRGNHQLLEAGMVFTIEPGLYDLDSFGVRIEDDILVTETGARVLTSFPKELTLIG